MRCKYCSQDAIGTAEIAYVWGETLSWAVCGECWENGRENPAWLGSRRDRAVTFVLAESAERQAVQWPGQDLGQWERYASPITRKARSPARQA